MPFCLKAFFVALASVALLTGCAGGGGNVAAPVGATKMGLSLAEVDAVTIAARKMIGDDGAQVHGLKSRKEAGAGTHVCGYVRKAAGGASTPMYIELRGSDAATTAERGQIGATPENLAKVKFMCRSHGDW